MIRRAGTDCIALSHTAIATIYRWHTRASRKQEPDWCLPVDGDFTRF